MGSRHVLTDRDVRNAFRSGQKTLRLSADTIITPLALDTARELGLELSHPVETAAPASAVVAGSRKVVALGSDHGGFQLKKQLIPFLVELGWQIRDVGTDSEESCDYPDFAYMVARLVASGDSRFGIMIDGAGIGSAMTCNKVAGIRAACPYNEFTAWNSRAHNDANVLTLGSRTLGIEVCKSIVRTFLATDFEGGRHKTRVDKISDLDRMPP